MKIPHFLSLITLAAIPLCTAHGEDDASIDTMAQTLPGQVVAPLPGQVVPALPGQIVQSLPGQIVHSLPGQAVPPLSGQIVPILSGQTTPPLAGQIVRLLLDRKTVIPVLHKG